MTTTNSVTITEITVSQTDSTKASWGAALDSVWYFVLANGSVADETFDWNSISTGTKALMAQYGRGVSIKMGDGNDTVIGSDYGDVITGGNGVNKIDGGDNQGTDPNGNPARDALAIFVDDAAGAAAVSVTALDGSASGADLTAFNEGYLIKVVSGGETDYLKNVEQINVFQNDTNKTFLRGWNLTVNVTEAPNTDTSGYMHLAWAQGTAFADSFDAATALSGAIQTRMDTQQRGVWVDMGAGNDTVVGSGYGDDITLGAGTNYADGGANAGSPPWGGKAQDVLHVNVADQAAADAVTVTQLTGTLSGADATAAGQGYTHKVVAGSEIDYIKGIEKVTVQIATSNSTSWVRDIPLTVVVNEANLGDSNIANYYTLAWANGTDAADTIDFSGNTALLS
ncbi:MAG: hypothetical protein ACXU8N_12200, partial [Telluria sp.]